MGERGPLPVPYARRPQPTVRALADDEPVRRRRPAAHPDGRSHERPPDPRAEEQRVSVIEEYKRRLQVNEDPRVTFLRENT